MTTYIRVPEIHDCDGCAVNHNAQTEGETFEDQRCTQLSDAIGGCYTHKCIWIEDHEASRLAYITLKLEN
jgi:hypothetical protein